MPRKTAHRRAGWILPVVASMRPRPDAAENRAGWRGEKARGEALQ